MTRTKRGPWLIAIATWLFAGGVADAKPPTTVAVLGIEPAAGAPPDVASQLTTALKNRVLRVPGFQLIQGKNLDEVKLVFGCVDEKPPCMARVGRSLQASKLLWGSIRPAGSDYTIVLHYLDVPREALERTVTERVTQDEAARPSDAVARVTASFLVSGGTIKLGCNVVGAKVLLGTAVKGLTDDSTMLIQDVPAGTHLLRIRKRGYQTWRRRVTLTTGQTLEIDAEMNALPADGGAITPPPPDDTDRRRHRDGRRGWQVAFWSSAAVTIGLSVGVVIAGLSVRDLEQDKETAATALLTTPDLRGQLKAQDVINLQTGNACAVSASGVTAGVASICDDGNTRATIVNALVGASILGATVSAYFLYKAYIAGPGAREEESDEAISSRRRWRVTTAAGPDGAQLGLSLRF